MQAGEVEIPWWTYGARGMQLWFPSSLHQPLSPHARDIKARASTDPELEFDREVYPVGISLTDVAIIGEPCSPPGLSSNADHDAQALATWHRAEGCNKHLDSGLHEASSLGQAHRESMA